MSTNADKNTHKKTYKYKTETHIYYKIIEPIIHTFKPNKHKDIETDKNANTYKQAHKYTETYIHQALECLLHINTHTQSNKHNHKHTHE